MSKQTDLINIPDAITVSGSNVGIGTSSPSTKLDVGGVIQFLDDNTPEIKIIDPDDSNYALIGYSDGTMTLSSNHGNEAGGANVLKMFTGGSERMRIDGSGNVGIGTSSPSTPSGSCLSLYNATLPRLNFKNSTTGDGTLDGFELYMQGTLAGINNKENGAIAFGTNDSERMRLDSSGNVGIGTTNGDVRNDGNAARTYVSIIGTANRGVLNIGSTASAGADGGKITFVNGTNAIGEIYVDPDSGSQTNGFMVFSTSNSERMRIDSSGNLLVGKTTSSSSSVGAEFRPDGIGIFGRDSNVAILANRNTSDGDIISIRKDGTTVGSIGTHASNITIGTGATGLRFYDTDNVVMPRNPSTGASVNGTISLGEPLNRFRNLYLSGGVFLGGTGTANKLSDYEEGTWTPTIAGGGTASYTSAGEYTKIGNTVIAVWYVQFSSWSGNAQQNIEISLPFTSATGVGSGHAGGGTLGAYGGMTSYSPMLGGWVADNKATTFLLGSNGNNDRTLKGNDVASNFYIYQTTTYRVP